MAVTLPSSGVSCSEPWQELPSPTRAMSRAPQQLAGTAAVTDIATMRRPSAYRPVYRPRYVYVDPAPNYQTYYRRPYREDWRWHHPHRWQHWGQGEGDGRGWDRQDY